MAKFDQTVCLEQAVESVEKQADGIFKLVTNKEIHYSKTVIITAGNGAFQPRRLEQICGTIRECKPSLLYR